VGAGAITGPAPAPVAPLQPERGGFAENLREQRRLHSHSYYPGPLRPASGHLECRPGPRTLSARVPGTRSAHAAGGPGLHGVLPPPTGGPGATGLSALAVPGPAAPRSFAPCPAAGGPLAASPRYAGPGSPPCTNDRRGPGSAGRSGGGADR